MLRSNGDLKPRHADNSNDFDFFNNIKSEKRMKKSEFIF